MIYQNVSLFIFIILFYFTHESAILLGQQIFTMNINPIICITKIFILIFLIASGASLICNMSNCQTCNTTSPTQCKTCMTGFKLTGSACCNNTLNCGSCLTNSSICQNCTSNAYFLVNQICKICASAISQCDTCANSTTCLTCKPTYVVNSTSECQLCSQFMSLCLKCINTTICTQCINNTYAVNKTSSMCQTCGSFINNCTKCNNQNTCITCVVNPNIVLSNGKCPYCSQVIPYCLNCTNYYYCTLCTQYHAIKQLYGKATCEYCSNLMVGCLDCSSASNCTKCSSGYIVVNGCSTVPGCISVNQSASKAICTACNYPQFQLQPLNGTCICRYGHLAGFYCTSLTGCINIARKNGTDACTICNSALYFELYNKTCMCQPYFQLNGTACTQICGDGRLFVLQCDDGNTISGDGCSSACKIEKEYACTHSANHGASVCAYGGKFTLALQCINNLGANTASIVFKVSPSIPNFIKQNLDNRISFITSENCTMTSYYLTESSLSISVAFKSDVENANVELSIKYDSNYIISPDFTTSFKMIECNGNKLLFDVNYSEQNKNIISGCTKILVILAWISFFVSSYHHKMIGVQTIHTLQLIFIIQVLSHHYMPVLAYFDALNYTLNAYQRFITKSSTIDSIKYYSRLYYSPNFIENILVIVLLELLAIIIYISLILIKKITLYQLMTKNQQPKFSIQQISYFQQKTYKFLIFPLLVGTYVHFIISLMIHTILGTYTSHYMRYFESFAALSMMVSTSIVLFNEWKGFLILGAKPEPIDGMKDGYIQLYLTNIFFLSIIGYLCLSQMISFNPVFVFSSALFLNSILLLFLQPYKDKVHYLGIIFNNIGILFNIGWVLSQQYIFFSKYYEEFIAFANTVILAIIVIWSFCRVIFEIKNKQQQVESKNNAFKKVLNRKMQAEQMARILKENQKRMYKYCLGSQIIRTDFIKNQQTGQDYMKRLKQLRHERKKILRRQLLQKKVFEGGQE